MSKKKPVTKQAPKKKVSKPVKVLATKKSVKAPAKVSTKNPSKAPVKAPVVAKPTRKPVKKVVKPLKQEPLTEVLSAPPATLPEPAPCLQEVIEVTGDVQVCPIATCDETANAKPSWWPPDPTECER